MKDKYRKTYGDLAFYHDVTICACKTLKSIVIGQALWLERNQPHYSKKNKSKKASMHEVIPKSLGRSFHTEFRIAISFDFVVTVPNISEVAKRLQKLDKGVIRYHLKTLDFFDPWGIVILFMGIYGQIIRPISYRSVPNDMNQSHEHLIFPILRGISLICSFIGGKILGVLICQRKNRF